MKFRSMLFVLAAACALVAGFWIAVAFGGKDDTPRRETTPPSASKARP